MTLQPDYELTLIFTSITKFKPMLFEPSSLDSLPPTTHPVKEIRRVTFWGLGVNLLLSFSKLAIGILGHSQALIADAVHSLSDTSTDLAVLIGVRFWSAPADANHPHGHGRIETLISFFISIVIAGIGAGLAYRAIQTLPERAQTIPEWSVFTMACLSIIIKEFLYRWTVHIGKRVKSSAVIANAWHQRSDAFSSVPVAIAVLASRIQPNWVLLDSIATVIVSVLILQAVWKIARPALDQLIDTAADHEEQKAILNLALDSEGVLAIHALRTRYIGPGLQVDLHVLVEPELTVREGHDIAGAVKERLLRQSPNVVDVLVHIEPNNPPS
jgi:cation diffusion facilitator family transporter